MRKKWTKSIRVNGLMKGTIRGKIIQMGTYGVVAAILIGTVGIVSINENSKNSKIGSIVNDISVLQYQNQALEVSYQYYIDATYLNNITNNLEQMENRASELQKIVSAKYKDSIASLKEKLELSKDNYESLIDHDSSRGFVEEKGNLNSFFNVTQELNNNYKTLISGNEWYEIKWIDAVMQGTEVTIDGKDYIKMTYNGPVPEIGKRDNLGVRIGGTFSFNKNYYVNNFRFTNGSEVQPIELVNLKQSSGEGVESAEIATFNNQPAIHVKAKFNAANQTWEEAATDITIKPYEIQNYKNIMYDIYFEKTGSAFEFKYGGSVNGYYLFEQETQALDSLVKEYNKKVVEGKDVSELYSNIEASFNQMIDNVPKYAIDKAIAEDTVRLLTSKKGLFESIGLQDEDVLRVKAENAQLFTQLEELCSSVKAMADDDMQTVKNSVLGLTLSALLISAILLFLTTLRTSKRIQKSVISFQDTLDAISDGKVSARVDQIGNDEFGQFGHSINSFMDKLQTVIQKLQQASLLLSNSGAELDERALRTKDAADVINCALRDISSGAADQAHDVESSSIKVIEMRDIVDGIISSVDELTKLTTDMKIKDDEATAIMLQLSKSNDTTTEAFRKIANQIRKTNDSVEKIQNAVDLIASIASQTNLLSLNASIEAARAGEAGKGFAVVASEIQKLAEQTNSSAGIINNIITSLSAESEQTVQSINELTGVVDEQGQNLEETKKRFAVVSQGIQSTEKEMLEVRQQANLCSKSGGSVGNIMVNLSAIAEQNAASTEQTTNSMAELNDATISLAETAEELRGLSQSLNEDLSFFQVK